MANVFQNDDESVTVSYPVKEATQSISKADYYAVRCIGESNKVRAIKFVRMQTGLGLYESKQIVDTIMGNADVLKDWVPPPPTSLGALLRSKLDTGSFSCDE